MSNQNNIEFPDAEIVSYKREQDTITVTVRKWDERIAQLVFLGALGLVDFGIGDITGLVQAEKTGSVYDSIIERTYERRPQTIPYRLFRFLDLNDESCLEIVSISYEITSN